MLKSLIQFFENKKGWIENQSASRFSRLVSRSRRFNRLVRDVHYGQKPLCWNVNRLRERTLVRDFFECTDEEILVIDRRQLTILNLHCLGHTFSPLDLCKRIQLFSLQLCFSLFHQNLSVLLSLCHFSTARHLLLPNVIHWQSEHQDSNYCNHTNHN